MLDQGLKVDRHLWLWSLFYLIDWQLIYFYSGSSHEKKNPVDYLQQSNKKCERQNKTNTKEAQLMSFCLEILLTFRLQFFLNHQPRKSMQI